MLTINKTWKETASHSMKQAEEIKRLSMGVHFFNSFLIRVKCLNRTPTRGKR